MLNVQNLTISFPSDAGEIHAVVGASMVVEEGEIVALLGESGSGKSTLLLALLGIIRGFGRLVDGRVVFRDIDLFAASQKELRRIRGKRIGLLLQEPSKSFDPLYTVGSQIAEAITEHGLLPRNDAKTEAVRALKGVGIADSERRAANYPFEFSGGMLQRAMIAMGLSMQPELLLADEPTTSLDATTQAQVLELLAGRANAKGIALVIATHNFGIVARYASRVYVMYAGRIVEVGDVDEIFDNPLHPYTVALMQCVPRLDGDRIGAMQAITGEPPLPGERIVGCAFAPRCPRVMAICRVEAPALLAKANTRHVACHAVTDQPAVESHGWVIS